MKPPTKKELKAMASIRTCLIFDLRGDFAGQMSFWKWGRSWRCIGCAPRFKFTDDVLPTGDHGEMPMQDIPAYLKKRGYTFKWKSKT